MKEKALTRARDALAAERRRMPWLPVPKEYEFAGPSGKVSLVDLFAGRRQLIVYRAFFEPGVFGWPERQDEWEDSPEGYPQTPPYKWWNWHDNYNAEASPDPKWVQISDVGEAAFRKRDADGARVSLWPLP